MAKLILSVVVGNNSRSIASSDDDSRAACGSLDVRVEEVFRTPSESRELEHSSRPVVTRQYTHFVLMEKREGLHPPVPQDGLRLSDRLAIQLAALWSDIKSKPSIGNTALVRRRTSLGVLVELVGGDVVDWENKLDALGLGLFYQRSNLLGARLVEERVADLRGSSGLGEGGKGWCTEGTDLDAFKSLLEGESHTTSDNKRVDLDRNTYISGKRDRWQYNWQRTLSNIFSISWILSETFAPPRIAKNGLSGCSRTFAKNSSSFFIKKPAARCCSCTPTILECAR
jgi:hypothetical protein